MSSCSTPVNRHDLAVSGKERGKGMGRRGIHLQGTIKQPKNGQKMELGGEIYSLDDMIGEGGFAKVFLCTNEKKELLAMKVRREEGRGGGREGGREWGFIPV